MPTVEDHTDRGVIASRDEDDGCPDDFIQRLVRTLLLLDGAGELTERNGKFVVPI